MGEGAIEGHAAEYEVGNLDPFAVEFKYSRFYATHARPRDVSALTGVHHHVKAGNGMEGATMQGDDTLVADPAAAALSVDMA